MPSHTAISGSPAQGIYSQTLAVGHFFVVLSLEGENANLELGRNILSKVEEIITQTPEISPKELVEIEHTELTSSGIKLSLLAAKIESQKLTIFGAGDVQAKLLRKNKIINLFPIIRPVSGTVLDGDFLVLGTISFFHQTDLSGLSLENYPVSEDPHFAALLVKINLTDHQETPVPTDVPPRSSRRFFPSFYHQSLLRHRPSLASISTVSRRRILYLSLIILIALICLIVFQLRSRVVEEREKKTQSIERSVQEQISSAQKLVGLNDTIARDLLIQARQDLTSLADSSFGKSWPGKLQKLKGSLDDQISAVSHIYSISTLDTFYDFSLLKSGAKISSVWAHKDEAVSLDKDNGAIYSLNLTTKGATIIAGSDDLKKGKYTDFSAGKIYVWAPDGIISVDRSVSPSVSKLLLKPSDKWGEIVDLKVFAGNIYLLDVQKHQIWKYQNTDLGFADVSSYLSARSVDFSNAKSLAIDGSINVLTSTGNLARFTGGSPENFKIGGLPDEALAKAGLQNPTSFFATDETTNIYILDSNTRKVVVLSKKGQYLAQYLISSSQNLEPRTFLVVSEPLRQVFLFSGAKVYSFSLK